MVTIECVVTMSPLLALARRAIPVHGLTAVTFLLHTAHAVNHSIYRIVRCRVICNDLQLLQPLVGIMKRECHFVL